MPISGGVYTRSNGVHTGSTTWSQDYAAGTGIVASVHDVHDQDIATALNTCVFKDGSNTAVANLPMGGFKHTGVAAATTSGQYAEYAQMNAAIAAAAAAAAFGSGTTILFFQASAPTGWTQNTSYNDCALRVVSGTGGGAYTSGSGLSSISVSGTVGGHAITQAELPSYNLTVTDTHTHSYTKPVTGASAGAGGSSIGLYSYGPTATDSTTTTSGGSITVASGGSGNTHNHSFSGSATPNYINVIACSKN